MPRRTADYEKIEVVESCRLIVKWTLASIPTTPNQNSGLKMESGIQNNFPGSKAPTVMALFAPADKDTANRLLQNDMATLVCRNIYFGHLGTQCPIFEQADLDERKQALAHCNEYHYLLLDDGAEMILLGGKGVRFLPGKRWRPPEGISNGKKKRNGKKKLVSETRRKKAAIQVNCISLTPEDKISENSAYIRMSDCCPHVFLGERRFGKRFDFTFDNAVNLEPGDVINPAYSLTRANDPEFSGFGRDNDGYNALTNFRNVSIPLFWPDDWDDNRVQHLHMLKAWTERSYEAFIHFLEGKQIDSLEAFVPSEIAHVVETTPNECKRSCKGLSKNRDGQCYSGDYEKIEIIGPYFLFTVQKGEHKFYVLDSPFYGIALRAYWQRDDALDYMAGGGRRESAEKKLIWSKQMHDPDGKWETRFDANVETHVIGSVTSV